MDRAEQRNGVHSNQSFQFSDSNLAKFLIIEYDAGIFYHFYEGYILPFRPLHLNDKVICKELLFEHPTMSVREVWTVGAKEQEKVAYFFICAAPKVICEGSYLASFIDDNVGSYSTAKRLMKNEDLAIYEYANCGTLALATTFAPWFETVMQEQ